MLAVSNSLVVTPGALVHMFVGYFVAMATSHRLKVRVYHAHFLSPAVTTIVTSNNNKQTTTTVNIMPAPLHRAWKQV